MAKVGAERIAERAVGEMSRMMGQRPGTIEMIGPAGLPAFMRSGYHIVKARIGDESFTVFVPHGDEPLTAAQYDVHLRRHRQDGRSVLATSHMTRRMAEKLTDLAVPFIVPGRHFSVDTIGRTMGMRFDPPRGEESHPRPDGTIGAYAQAFLLLQIVRGDPDPVPTMAYARHFSITQTTVLKAFDELIDAGFCLRERDGAPQYLEFLLRGSDLFSAAQDRLASPVSNVGYLAGTPGREILPNSGERALARMSMLAETGLPTLAIHRSWPLVSLAARLGMEICNREDADLRVERWRYPPEALSENGMADPLSLFLVFRDHPDERVAMAAYEMLEEYWDAGMSFEANALRHL